MTEPIRTGAASDLGRGGADGPPSHRWWVLATVAIAQLMVVLDSTIVNIALPTAQRDLGFSLADRQWVVTAYSLAFGSLLLLGGRIADLIGRKRSFLIGVAGFAVASAVGGAATGFTMLIAARAVQGAFAALAAPSALALLNTTFPGGRDRGRAFGVFGAIAGAGGAIGLLLGGVLTEHLSWRWTLYVNVAFAALAFAGAAAFLSHEKASRAQRSGGGLDVPGAALVTSALLAVVYGFSNAETYAWSSPMSWAFITGGLVLLGAFGYRQTQAARPLLPPRIVLERNRAASYVSMFVVGAGIFGISLFLTYYLQQVLGYSPIRTGLAFLPMAASIMTASTLAAGVIVPRFGPRRVVPIGMALAAGGLLWLTALGTHSGYAAYILPPLIVAGLGFGLIISTSVSMATAGVEPRDAGVASAAVNTMQQIGGSLSTALLNTMAASALTGYLAGRDGHDPAVLVQAELHGYAAAYRWAAAFFALGLVISALLYRSGRPSGSARPDAPRPGGDHATESAEELTFGH